MIKCQKNPHFSKTWIKNDKLFLINYKINLIAKKKLEIFWRDNNLR